MQLGSIVIVMIDCLITLYAYGLDVDMYIKLKKTTHVFSFFYIRKYTHLRVIFLIISVIKFLHLIHTWLIF